ncbi:transposase [Sorangium sp. So ce764]|uniref:transposase n=1 Tax=unclassified Sorangium TaxID=2621164 RepID=UPI003F60A0CA
MPKAGKRRKFSAAEKLRIVREAAACTQRGDIEALLRREGIYSSLLTAWRKQLALHGSEALAGASPAASRSRTRRTGASPSSRSARPDSRRSSRSLRSSSISQKKSLPFWASTSRATKSADGRYRRAR